MKILRHNLLPKKLTDRDALTLKFSNIKPRFTFKGFKRLNNIKIKLPITGTLLVLFLLGYFPTPTFPPTIKQASVLAQNSQTAQVLPAQLPFSVQLPHPGYLSTRFSRYHPGIDLATGYGMPIHSIGEGLVIEANFSFWGYGNHVVISHPGGYKSLYAHLAKIYVNSGQQVDQNSILGLVGLTGHTSGSHTHLEVTKDSQYLDPLTILPPVQDYPSIEFLESVGGNVMDVPDQNKPLSKNLQPEF
ncbi:MAG: M23 family metallopeptidase [Candidatus Daviesbacteria bacterium]|nr:MAG: M23 family metallopeptidase [Candidatus Daviesbacteria bacterium]